MEFNWVGLVSLIFFYIFILFVGLFAAWRAKRRNAKLAGSNELNPTEDTMVAGRNLGIIIGLFSLTATWVDGGYLNGTAEILYTQGLLWCQGPVGFSVSLLVGGFFFAKPMRDKKYITMLDPFYEKFGKEITGILYLPALVGELFWEGAILATLGSTIEVVLGLTPTTSIIVSGVVAVIYTLAGGMYSVSYTDVAQMICIIIGLWLCVPYIWNNSAMNLDGLKDVDWLGEIKAKEAASWTDNLLMLIFGGIPWQDYFQRVLACKTSSQAKILSYFGGLACLLMAVPAAFIGTLVKNISWNETTYTGTEEDLLEHTALILPLSLQYLTPTAVAFVGLGAVSAAVMSSCDASILSASSMFVTSVYCPLIRPKASDRETLWVLRLAMIVMGACSTAMALTVSSVYGLWVLTADFVYVLLFPQLCFVIHGINYCNGYGSMAAFCVSLVLRMIGGEPVLNLRAAYKYPYYDEEENIQMFPFKTVAMLAGLLIIPSVSAIFEYIFRKGFIPIKYDFLGHKMVGTKHKIDRNIKNKQPEPVLANTKM